MKCFIDRVKTQIDILEAIYFRRDPKNSTDPFKFRPCQFYLVQSRPVFVFTPTIFWGAPHFSIDIWQLSCHYVMAAALAVSLSFYNALLQCLNFVLALRRVRKMRRHALQLPSYPWYQELTSHFRIGVRRAQCCRSWSWQRRRARLCFTFWRKF